MNIKGAILVGLAALCVNGCITPRGSITDVATEYKSPCYERIKPKHSREQIEAIVSDARTPKEAFESVCSNVEMASSADEDLACKSGVRFFSMQESYAFRQGDCMDGAIAFAALLSDNPVYEAKVAYLQAKEGMAVSHAIALYKENGKWGIVSFSNSYDSEKYFSFYAHGEKRAAAEKGIFNFLGGARYSSIEEAVQEFKEYYKKFSLVRYSSDELKYGTGIELIDNWVQSRCREISK